MYWRLNKIQYPVYNLGPGKRFAIWAQGCPIRCKGCINPETWDDNAGSEIHPAIISSGLLRIQNHFHGVTITGGEPFHQYETLMAFCAFIKIKTTLDIFVFTGFHLHELLVKFPDRIFLKTIDYLMDGSFLQDKTADDNTRGSSNQKLYNFDGENIKCIEGFDTMDKWSIRYSANSELHMAGIPRQDDFAKLTDMLRKAGIKIEI